MLIHAIDIDHPPGIGIASAIAPALETVYVHAAIVAIAAMTSEARTLLSCCRFGLTDGLIENFDEVHDAHGAAGGLQARGDLQQAAGIA